MKEFASLYAAYARRGVKEYGVLPGQTQIDNSAKGFQGRIPEAVKIGDSDAAEQVRLGGVERKEALTDSGSVVRQLMKNQVSSEPEVETGDAN